MEWSPERFLQQAAAIHEDVEHYIRRILEKTRYQDPVSYTHLGSMPSDGTAQMAFIGIPS